jgi:hypothetical protein
MWQASLQEKKNDVIYFDAYAADHFDDPFIAFSGEIIEFVKNYLSDGQDNPERTALIKAAVEVAKHLSVLALKIGIQAATTGIINATALKDIKDIGPEIAKGTSEIGEKMLADRLEKYSAEKDSLKKFRESLKNLAKKVKEEKKFPLVIIVDELDRCRPDFALQLLERIKHLFNVEGLAFVLLVNRDQIERYIKTVYGDGDAKGYLLKLGNLFVDLPSAPDPEGLDGGPGHEQFCTALMEHYGLKDRFESSGYFSQFMEMHAKQQKLTLRELELVYCTLGVHFASNFFIKIEPYHGWLLSVLAVLKVKRPEVYARVQSEQITADELCREIGTHQMRDQGHIEINELRKILELLFMPQANYDQVRKQQDAHTNDEITSRCVGLLERLFPQRHQDFMRIVHQLDRFSLRG